MVEITFYHQTHIRTNGDPTHGACDSGSTLQMSPYAPCVFHKLKEFIWNKLRLRYTVKQIYDKHKEIWWAWANVGGWPWMIFYNSKILPTWTRSTRKAFGVCTQSRHFPFNRGFVFMMMMFFISKMQVR